MHDWSKFLPSEFFPYARYFYGPEELPLAAMYGNQRMWAILTGCYKEAVERRFNIAWLKHQHRNSHHWQHWVLRNDDGTTEPIEMPVPVVYEMVCDWIGAGRAIHGRYDTADPCKEAREWYLKNQEKMLLHPETRRLVEIELCMWKSRATRNQHHEHH